MHILEDLPEMAKDEIKRADHLVYVTLKYTRTVDVIKNTITRLINAYNYAILEALEYAKEEKKIKEIPASAQDKVNLLKKLYKDNILDYIKLYELLKQLDQAPYTGKEEYRKNVTLIAKVGRRVIEVNIPVLIEYFNKTHEFVNLINSWVE
jgi:hypothetical protein